MCNAFIFCLKKQDIFFLKKKSCVDIDFISLIHFYVYIALKYQEFCLQDSSDNFAMPHSVK